MGEGGAKAWTMLIFIQWTAAQKKEKVWKEKSFCIFSSDMKQGDLETWICSDICEWGEPSENSEPSDSSHNM